MGLICYHFMENCYFSIYFLHHCLNECFNESIIYQVSPISFSFLNRLTNLKFKYLFQNQPAYCLWVHCSSKITHNLLQFCLFFHQNSMVLNALTQMMQFIDSKSFFLRFEKGYFLTVWQNMNNFCYPHHSDTLLNNC